MRRRAAAAAARRQGPNWAAGGGGMPKQKSKVGFSSCNASSTPLKSALLARQLSFVYVRRVVKGDALFRLGFLSWSCGGGWLKLPASARGRTQAWDEHWLVVKSLPNYFLNFDFNIHGLQIQLILCPLLKCEPPELSITYMLICKPYKTIIRFDLILFSKQGHVEFIVWKSIQTHFS